MTIPLTPTNVQSAPIRKKTNCSDDIKMMARILLTASATIHPKPIMIRRFVIDRVSDISPFLIVPGSISPFRREELTPEP